MGRLSSTDAEDTLVISGRTSDRNVALRTVEYMWKYNIKTNLKQGVESVERIDVPQDTVESSSRHGDESSSAVKYVKFLDWLNCYQLPNSKYASWQFR